MKTKNIISPILLTFTLYSSVGTMQNEGCSLSDLPDETLIQIFSNIFNQNALSTPREMRNANETLADLKTTNHKFNQLLNSQELGTIFKQAGINIDAQINKPGTALHGCTILHLAAAGNYINIINALIAARADVYATIDNLEYWAHGMTALHVAARDGHHHVINILITAIPNEQKAAFVNQRDGNSYTALHWAVQNGHLQAVKALISAGADVHIIINRPRHASDGLTALQVIEGRGPKDSVVHALILAGAQIPKNWR